MEIGMNEEALVVEEKSSFSYIERTDEVFQYEEINDDEYEDKKEYFDLNDGTEGGESRQKRRILSKGSSSHGSSQRVIAHVDLDCFYVQVERYHNSNLKDKPVAVVQYNPFGDLRSYAPSENRLKDNGSIIAVSYEARACGVTRIMRGGEARKVCPEILLVQVPTAHGKADLQIYREASAKILKVLGSRFSSVIIERASIDEMYLDVTAEAVKYLEQFPDPEVFLSESVELLRTAPTLIAGDDMDEIKFSKRKIRDGHAGTTLNNYVSDGASNERFEKDGTGSDWFSRPFQEWTTEDRLLIAGARIIQQLRKDVFEQLGFTCSAGIAENKMLSKLASGMHKPNKQTIVPKVFVADMMINLPFSRVQGFGGKLGEDIIKYFENKVTTMGDLLALPRQQLIQIFKEDTTDYILSRARGIDDEAVQDRSLPLQIGCSKSFRASNILLLSDFLDGSVLFWLKELASELTHRIAVDSENNHRKPKQLHIGFTFKVVDGKGESMNQRSSRGGEEDRNIRLPQTTKGKTVNSSTENRVSNWFEEQGISLSKITKIPSQLSVDAIAQLALSLIQKALNENPRIQQLMMNVVQFNQDQNNIKNGMSKHWGLTSLGISAVQFEKIPQGKSAITSFLLKKQQPSRKDDGNIAAFSTIGCGQTENPLQEIKEDSNASFSYGSGLKTEGVIIDESSRISFIDCDEKDFSRDILSNNKRKISSLHSSEEEIEVLPVEQNYVTKSENSLQIKKLQSFYDKYLKHSSASVDLETFLSFPQDIQQELMNQVLFEKNFSRKGQLGNPLKKNTSKNMQKDHKTKSLNEWFSMTKK